MNNGPESTYGASGKLKSSSRRTKPTLDRLGHLNQSTVFPQFVGHDGRPTKRCNQTATTETESSETEEEEMSSESCDRDMQMEEDFRDQVSSWMALYGPKLFALECTKYLSKKSLSDLTSVKKTKK